MMNQLSCLLCSFNLKIQKLHFKYGLMAARAHMLPALSHKVMHFWIAWKICFRELFKNWNGVIFWEIG